MNKDIKKLKQNCLGKEPEEEDRASLRALRKFERDSVDKIFAKDSVELNDFNSFEVLEVDDSVK